MMFFSFDSWSIWNPILAVFNMIYMGAKNNKVQGEKTSQRLVKDSPASTIIIAIISPSSNLELKIGPQSRAKNLQ